MSDKSRQLNTLHKAPHVALQYEYLDGDDEKVNTAFDILFSAILSTNKNKHGNTNQNN